MRNFICLILVLCFVGQVSAKLQRDWPSASMEAVDSLGDRVKIQVASQIPGFVRETGVMPLEITVENHTTAVVSYEFRIGNGRGAMQGEHITTRIEVAPKSLYEGVTWVPYQRAGYYSTGNITVKGSHLRQAEMLYLDLHQQKHRDGRVSTVRKGAESNAAEFFSLYGMETFPTNQDWLSNVSQLEIHEQQWNTLPIDTKKEILDWVFQGGDLMLASLLPSNKPTEKVGLGGIRTTSPNAPADWNRGSDKDAREQKWLEEQRKSLANETQSGSMMLWIVFGILLPLYAVLAGPMVITKFASEQRRHRIFVVLPSLALVASCVLALLILLQDGTGGVGSRSAIYLLNPETKKGHLLQVQGSKTGLLLGSSFSLPSDILLRRDEDSSMGFEREANLPVLFEPSKGISTYSGAWFQSRNVQRHLLSRTKDDRGTYQLSNTMELTSSSSESLKNVFVLKDKEFYKTPILKSGQKVRLEKATVEEFQAFRHRLGIGNFITSDGFPEGGLLAELEDPNQILEPTLKSIEWKNDKALLFTVCTP